ADAVYAGKRGRCIKFEQWLTIAVVHNKQATVDIAGYGSTINHQRQRREAVTLGTAGHNFPAAVVTVGPCTHFPAGFAGSNIKGVKAGPAEILTAIGVTDRQDHVVATDRNAPVVAAKSTALTYAVLPHH